MDAILALIFIFALIVSGVLLFITLWVGSVALLIRPAWVADRLVHRFWPERKQHGTVLSCYRITGAVGVALAVVITWVALLEVIR